MVNAGRILIIAKGEWNNTTNYVQLDLVTHENIAYLARKASVGINPANDPLMEYWQPFGVVSDVATTSRPGLVMPDGTTITVDATGLIKATPGIEDIKEVSIVSLANKQVLRYNTATSKWENVSLGAAADKGTTSSVTQNSTDLIESGAVYTAMQNLTANTYNINDSTLSEVASDDLVPVYDTSADEKKQITVSNIIGQTVSNPNLLDNPWFTVNQRGQSSYSDVGYTVDRWYMGSSATGTKSVTVNSDETVTVANEAADSTYVYFFQRLDKAITDKLLNKMVTISVMLSDGTIFSTSKVFATVYFGYITVNEVRLGGYRIWINSTTGVAEITVDVYASKSISIKAVKLELGSVSTLAMDTAPNYATELLKCQRYFVRLKPAFDGYASFSGLGFVFSATGTRAPIDLPVAMRATPAISKSGAIGFIGITSAGIIILSSADIQSLTLFDDVSHWHFMIGLVHATGVSPTVGTLGYIRAMNDASAYIDFSADL